MHRGQSLYLDALRLLAALEVFAFHLAGFPGTGCARAAWNAYGHEAVTIFFVLSGFVIRHAAGGRRDADLRAFAISRLTRVYSVAIPALVLTLLFDRIGQLADPAVYEGLMPHGPALLRLAIGAAMLNETWVSVQILSNTPYWSISYEFWYYGIFAACFYLRGRTRWLAAAAVALIAGPRILLLLPIWLMGWLAYTERWTERWPRWAIWLAFAQPVLLFAAYRHFAILPVTAAWLAHLLGHDLWREGLAWSRYVISDTLLGASAALNLAAAKRLGPALGVALGWATAPIRWMAARSFTLYLLHQPAILVTVALLSPRLPTAIRAPAIGAVAIALVLAVAAVTEEQRDRLKLLFERLPRPRLPAPCPAV